MKIQWKPSFESDMWVQVALRVNLLWFLQPDKMEVPRPKRKYEKKQKALPLLSVAAHRGSPVVFNTKDLNQYDFPSSDDEPYSQVYTHTRACAQKKWS